MRTRGWSQAVTVIRPLTLSIETAPPGRTSIVRSNACSVAAQALTASAAAAMNDRMVLRIDDLHDHSTNGSAAGCIHRDPPADSRFHAVPAQRTGARAARS